MSVASNSAQKTIARPRREKASRRRVDAFQIFNLIFLVSFALFCIVPFILVFIVSITDENAISKYGYSFFPKAFSLKAYELIFRGNPLIVSSYAVSITVTGLGTVLAVLITAMAGFTLANKHIKYRGFLAFFFFFTMIFNSGLVPWYMVSTGLGFKNNLLALIVPSLLFNPFNLFLVRNFMQSIPSSLMESAKMDGAHDSTIAFAIYFPLSIPVLATIALFYGLAYWNNWFNAIMLVENKFHYPLQYLLFRMQSEISMLNEISQASATLKPPTESMKMATTIVTVGPIFLLYPWLQRYFVRGLIVGSIKG